MGKHIIKEGFEADFESVRKALKALDSQKCNLVKRKDGFTESKYSEKMAKILAEIQVLREIRNQLTHKELTIPEMTKDQMDNLSIDEVNHGLKSLQSRKYMNKYEPEGLIYKDTLEREAYLIGRRSILKGNDTDKVSKSKIQSLIERLSNLSDRDKSKIIMAELSRLNDGE